RRVRLTSWSSRERCARRPGGSTSSGRPSCGTGSRPSARSTSACTEGDDAVFVVKWTLVFFAVLAVALVVLSKLIAFLNPPRRGRTGALALRRCGERLTWLVLVPALVGVALVVVSWWLGPWGRGSGRASET